MHYHQFHLCLCCTYINLSPVSVSVFGGIWPCPVKISHCVISSWLVVQCQMAAAIQAGILKFRTQICLCGQCCTKACSQTAAHDCDCYLIIGASLVLGVNRRTVSPSLKNSKGSACLIHLTTRLVVKCPYPIDRRMARDYWQVLCHAAA